MTYGWQFTEFAAKTNQLAPLPLRANSDTHEFVSHAETGWIDGIRFEEEPARDLTIRFDRFANNDPGCLPIIDYVIGLCPDRRTTPIEFSPSAAIDVGRFLIQAGTAALRDLAANSEFLAEGDGSC
ncbi:hypothetical protein QSJ19_01480 [Gordonia sp. ABSL11-1]|uniref:hypothetical protein n=1 Tax=Gordonia sp. ABSL11-1 TaxID=3053924 RepID=UPI00257264B5|nr:hypothetical protein [Gordonia sp. ABSL11-1]MDL9944274.1 hypothetical protein [Gordonia sp. ABSL11-1]